METVFTPWQSLIGGSLIGFASVCLMGLHGRIMGATGIFSGFVCPNNFQEWLWRAVLLAGMLCAPIVYFWAEGRFPVVEVTVSSSMVLLGGFLVGVGVVYANGCTSGHGICGLARTSYRSLMATLTFMIAAALSVFVMRHVLGA